VASLATFHVINLAFYKSALIRQTSQGLEISHLAGELTPRIIPESLVSIALIIAPENISNFNKIEQLLVLYHTAN